MMATIRLMLFSATMVYALSQVEYNPHEYFTVADGTLTRRTFYTYNNENVTIDFTNFNPDSLDFTAWGISSIPNDVLPTSLETLQLEDNEISNIAFVLQLSYLTTLNLANNHITAVPNMSSSLLDDLNLANNNITIISPLTFNAGLQHLNLQHNQISDISFLKDMHQLTYLVLANNQITDIPAGSFNDQLDNNALTLYLQGNLLEKIGSKSFADRETCDVYINGAEDKILRCTQEVCINVAVSPESASTIIDPYGYSGPWYRSVDGILVLRDFDYFNVGQEADKWIKNNDGTINSPDLENTYPCDCDCA